MGNTYIEEKQIELKKWIKKVGITQAEFARRVFCHMHDSDNENELSSFCENFKKHLNRNASIELLETYLEILFQQDEFLKLNCVKPRFHYDESFNAEFKKEMGKISKHISDHLNNREDC